MKTAGGGRTTRTLYCTYCSAGKQKTRAPMSALRRYVSPRIRAVHRMSRGAGAPFAILSGKFGLLGPYEKIPCYDHLLKAGEVAALLPRVTGYLDRKGIRAVRFFHEPLSSNRRLKPYLDAITRSCRLAGVRLILSEYAPDHAGGGARPLYEKRETRDAKWH
ncbi:MAG: hypothetical protein WCP22_06250 [Chlamydiota bacterium]